MLRSTKCAVLLVVGLWTSSFLGVGVASSEEPSVAVIAGGCFWCVEADFDKVPGVIATTSGFAGGELPNPTYEEVKVKPGGHREAVKIEFDPDVLTYDELLEIFWRSVDPTDGDGQFCDRGDSYTTAIFVTNEEQRRIAEASKHKLDGSGVLGNPIATPILELKKFFPAGKSHQDFHTNNPIRYRFNRYTCNRDSRVRDIWGEEAHRGILHP